LHQNTRPVWTSFFICCALLLLTGCGRQPEIEVGKQTIERDTTWSGIILVSGDVYVPPGVTLTIAPGTVVKFKRIDKGSDRNLFLADSPYYPEAELIIRGRLLAKGTRDKWVVFTSAEREARPADWGAINFLGSAGSVIEYAKILCAYNGIHAHGSSITVDHCEIVNNGVGISIKKEEETKDAAWFGKQSDLVITNCLITRNKGGIGFRNSKAIIRNNEITDNKFFGIWPKEECEAIISHNRISGNLKGIYLFQVRGVTIEYNNIFDNREYNLAIAEAQDYPLVARNNWFDTTNPQKIDELIFDRKDDPGVAEIVYMPFLEQPVQLEKR